MTFYNAKGKSVLIKMVKAIQENKTYLGDIDGLIGDGDHGANMNKGFSIFESRLDKEEVLFTEGLDLLGTVLFSEIGGSMGPIYGTIFMSMAEAGEEFDAIGLEEFKAMLVAASEALSDIIEAQVGDKTIVDTLHPAIEALQSASSSGSSFSQALEDMKVAAKNGSDSTVNLVAKYGRSSRLGERSRGVLDAGSVSCYLLLAAMADGILEIIS